MRVAINGLGRIGRIVFKRALEKGINVVAINDQSTIETIAYLLKYDSIYGVYNQKIETGKNFIKINNKKILVLSEDNPEKLPWKKLGIDVVIESTGVFTDREGASKHLTAGAKKVIISAPAKNPDATIVLGVNEKILKKEHKIISLASCTTNCIAPVIKILNDKFGIEKGYLTTIHAYTNDQNILDTAHRKVRRSRAGAINLIPTTSGAATSVSVVIPNLKGKLDGMAIRAPVACGSITDFVATLKKSVTTEKINKVIKDEARKIKGVLEYTEDEIVSSDVIRNSHSSIFDSKLTKTNGNMIKVLCWYDNEYGYSCRVIDFLGRLKSVI
ncbi:MAG: type I glyceraldehyde-3-phosphate dehydrogenase [Nanoarchaeota archaeon]|nr:type I glyceraldehyde-3-phosphate dehydrogenase [Nanoarchaeota archaeon]